MGGGASWAPPFLFGGSVTLELAGRAAIVTGASRGIGRAAAEALAKAGARVVLTARTAKDGEDAAAAIRKGGGVAHFIQQDVADPSAWRRVFAEAREKIGPLSIFVANAGISFPKPALEMSIEECRQMLNVNLAGVFFGLQEAVSAIREKGGGGSIILLSSVVGKIGAPAYTHYAAAKGGVRLMAKAAALELGAEQIRVNSVHPGFVRTDMTSIFPEAAMAPLVPLGRFGEPREIADPIVYLASDRSKFLTGAEIVLDGGLTVR